MADPKTEYTVSEKENGSNGSKHDKTKSNEKKSNKKEKKKMHGKDKTKEPKVKGKKGKKGKDTNKCEKIEQTVFSKVLNPKPKKDEKPNVRVSGFERDFEFHITSFTTGRQLFDMVIDQVNIREVWFFGLSFVDSKGYMAWLKLKKKVFSQDVGKRKPIHFRFLAKFYPEDVSKELYEPATKMHFYLQIQDSILSSKIFCPPETAVLLASYDCQHRFGDYTPDIHKRGFLADETVLPDKTLETYDMTAQQWEERIVSFYKDHSGMSSDTAVTEYLKVSQDLEMYGVNYFEIRNKKGTELMLGVDAMGLNVYEKDNKLTPKIGFPWSEIRAISFNDKKLIIKPVDDKIPDPDLKLEINSQTNSCCACVSQTKNFAFYTHKVRANKDILALCMGNHELYMRRRQTTTGKEDGGQTEGASGEAGNANKQANVSNSPPVSLSTSNQGTSAKSSPMPSLIGKTALTSESPGIVKSTEQTSPQTSPCISDHNSDYQRPDHCKPLSVTPIHDGEFSERAIDVPCVEELKVTFSEDETEEIFRPQSPEEDYDVDEEIPILTPKPTRTPTPLASEPAAESRNGSRLSHYDPPEPKIEVTLVKEVQENLEPEKDLESKDTAKCKAKEVLWDTSVEGEATMNNNILERTPEVEKNQETYEKLVHLYENLSKKEKRKNRENHIHRKMKNENIDKYKTLQKIREGNTKERISIFEAM